VRRCGGLHGKIATRLDQQGVAMPFTPDLVDELNTLVRFDLASTQHGIKIHKSADPAIIAATRRLHTKGLLTQPDGGYLTSLGRDAAEHVQAALTILSSTPSAAMGQIRALAPGV
jgi:uncharacterized protein (TIGR02647 family)